MEQSVFFVSYYLPHIHTTFCGSMSSQSAYPHSTEMAHAKVSFILVFNQPMCLKMQDIFSLKCTFVLIYLKTLLDHLLFLFNFRHGILSFAHFFTLFFSVLSLVLFFSDFIGSLTVSSFPLLELPPYRNDRFIITIFFCRSTSFFLYSKLKSSSQTASFCSYLTEWHHCHSYKSSELQNYIRFSSSSATISNSQNCLKKFYVPLKSVILLLLQPYHQFLLFFQNIMMFSCTVSFLHCFY